jgi:SAM-dependent methyltransferase
VSEAYCRLCSARLRHTFVDLGLSPLAHHPVEPHRLNRMEPFFPLRVLVCERCLLVQLQECVAPTDLGIEQACFSSYSDSWLRHARAYTEQVVERFGIGAGSQVIEIGSNDGYLLQYFVERGIPALGIEPAANVVQAASARGVRSLPRLFGEKVAAELAAEGTQADLLVGNNVLAHVPDVNDFVAGLRLLLKPRGVITMEFSHLLRLMEDTQFDTIHHERFSYLSLIVVERLFAAHGLALFDVEELPTHGGSLRIYARHADDTSRPPSPRVAALRLREQMAGGGRLDSYLSFGAQVEAVKRGLLEFLIRARREGKSVAGYGAPCKGNTLLNYCGIRSDFLEYTVDRSPHKQGKFTPGTHIPIHAPDHIRRTRPDYVLILPWNLRDEIMEQLAHIREWGGRFVVPIPDVRVYL